MAQLTHSAAMDTVRPEHKAALEAEGVDTSNLIQLLLKHGCDVAPGIRLIVPILPVSTAVKVAVIAVVDLVCPIAT